MVNHQNQKKPLKVKKNKAAKTIQVKNSPINPWKIDNDYNNRASINELIDNSLGKPAWGQTKKMLGESETRVLSPDSLRH